MRCANKPVDENGLYPIRSWQNNDVIQFHVLFLIITLYLNIRSQLIIFIEYPYYKLCYDPILWLQINKSKSIDLDFVYNRVHSKFESKVKTIRKYERLEKKG